MSILLSLFLVTFSQAMDFTADLSAQCATKQKEVALFQTTHSFVSADLQTVKATLTLAGEAIPLNELVFASMNDGGTKLGVMYGFSGGSVVIFNKAKGPAGENGLLAYVMADGSYVEEWMDCSASAGN